jgi:glycosyltransferase involved in cell wall biosynthesis
MASLKDRRVAVYCDFSYRVSEGAVYAQLPFSLFLEQLASHCERMVVLGREDPTNNSFPFRITTAEFVGLPFYRSGADLTAVLTTIPAALRRFWRVLDDIDVLWILGPNPPHVLLFALLGVLRRRKVVLGVRQNLPELIRHRRPKQRLVRLAAWALEWAWRMLALRLPVVVVGPDLAHRYRRSRSLLSIYVSLLKSSDLLSPEDDHRDYDTDELVMLSVGRLDPEKNPLLLADILCSALRSEPRWRLEVCGNGPLAEALSERAAALGVSERLETRGYVPVSGGLWDHYRNAHVLIHVSLTEGVPQVILEAFASRLPVVGTNVGGVGDVLSDRGILIPPEDVEAAVAGLNQMIGDPGLRDVLVEAAAQAARDHTLDAESARVAEFLSVAADR